MDKSVKDRTLFLVPESKQVSLEDLDTFPKPIFPYRRSISHPFYRIEKFFTEFDDDCLGATIPKSPSPSSFCCEGSPSFFKDLSLSPSDEDTSKDKAPGKWSEKNCKKEPFDQETLVIADVTLEMDCDNNSSFIDTKREIVEKIYNSESTLRDTLDNTTIIVEDKKKIKSSNNTPKQKKNNRDLNGSCAKDECPRNSTKIQGSMTHLKFDSENKNSILSFSVSDISELRKTSKKMSEGEGISSPKCKGRILAPNQIRRRSKLPTALSGQMSLPTPTKTSKSNLKRSSTCFRNNNKIIIL